jgi:hypothetical protein
MRRITKAFCTRASGAHPLRRSVNSEVEGLRVGLEIEEVPDRRDRSGMGHVQPGHGWDLVVGSIFQGTVELPVVPDLVRRIEHTLVQESHQDVGLLEVPVLVRGLA